MNPTIIVLQDIIDGDEDINRQSVELHLAFGHIGDGHGNFSESEKWSADTARFLLPFARAALANVGEPLDADTIAALRVLVEYGADDDRRVPYLLAELGCAFWDEGGVISIDSAAEKRWEAVLDAMEGK